MLFKIALGRIRPITSLTFTLNLDSNAPLCIVCRNGAGKTTLAKTIMNFSLADTFRRTTSDGALRDDSWVSYEVGGKVFEFTYDSALRTLSTRKPVPEALRSLVAVELPIPHGQRFSYFYTLAEADEEIRRAIILDDYTSPEPLISFLTRIYGEPRFAKLLEVKYSKGACCFFLEDDGRYVREDYFSSGEFFLVNLYRKIQSGPKLIFVDEIDISLDAAAQARLVAELRTLCQVHSVNVVFTSHSLALMQTLKEGELLHLDVVEGKSILEKRSFSFVKSLLFGFSGWDRYILVEDENAKAIIEHHIRLHCLSIKYECIVIPVGGAGQVLALMERNRSHNFLGPPDAVIAILDGDQRTTGNANSPSTYCMPLNSLESAFEEIYEQADFIPKLPSSIYNALPPRNGKGRPKALMKAFLRATPMSKEWMVESVCAPHANEIQSFAQEVLLPFLSFRQT
jgi:hypothetical protein